MNIREEAKKVDWNNSKKVVDFYESHKLYFSNADKIGDDDTLLYIVSIKHHYANALFLKSHYDKTYPVIDDAMGILDRVTSQPELVEKLRTLFTFLKARALNNQKNYHKAHPILKKLLDEDPDNITYRDWYLNNKMGTLNIYFWGITVVGVCLVFTYWIFDIEASLDLIGLFIIVGGYLSHEAIHWRFKSKLNNPN